MTLNVGHIGLGLLLEITFPTSHLYGLGAGVLFGVAVTATALGRSGE